MKWPVGEPVKPLAKQSKARIAAVYDAAASTYNRIGPSFFLHFGEVLAAEARVRCRVRILDVATGTGAVLIPVARNVQGKGSVVGIDISAGMIRRARSDILALGIANAMVLVADGESLPLASSSFDCALCSFGIFLFDDIARLLSECHRVLEHGGTIGLAYSAVEDPDWRWYQDLKAKYLPAVDLAPERHGPERVESLLSQLGFSEVTTRLETYRLVFANANEFWGWSWSHGDRAVLESMAARVHDFKRELFEAIPEHCGAEGLEYRVFAAMTLGTKS